MRFHSVICNCHCGQHKILLIHTVSCFVLFFSGKNSQILEQKREHFDSPSITSFEASVFIKLEYLYINVHESKRIDGSVSFEFYDTNIISLGIQKWRQHQYWYWKRSFFIFCIIKKSNMKNELVRICDRIASFFVIKWWSECDSYFNIVYDITQPINYTDNRVIKVTEQLPVFS